MTASPTFREALRFWLKLGCVSFGGPAGQIELLRAELVEKRRWVGEAEFFRALNVCMMLPGPEATQLAIWCGWRLHGTRGGLAAGILFVLPAAVLLWALAWIYTAHGSVPWLAAVFHGLKPAVAAIVAAAVLRLGARALVTPSRRVLAVAAFALIFFAGVPFPVIVAGAATVGWFGWWSATSRRAAEGRAANEHNPAGDETGPSAPRTSRSTSEPAAWRGLSAGAARTLGIGLTLWFAPVLAAGWWQGWGGVLAQEGIFFSKAALLTFGGAYAVLPYVGQQAVENYGWLTAPQMLDGLGLAETTPGPLIMVVQFVGFLGGWSQPGALPPLAMASLGAAMTTWTTFVPCFLWIFLCAPHLERLRRLAWLDAALGAVTTAVVGVVLNLAVWFGLHVLFPHGRSAAGTMVGGADEFAVVVAVAAFVALHRFKAGVITVGLASGALGLAWSFL